MFQGAVPSRNCHLSKRSCTNPQLRLSAVSTTSDVEPNKACLEAGHGVREHHELEGYNMLQLLNHV